MPRPFDAALEEQKLRDDAACSYCNRLAARILHCYAGKDRDALEKQWANAFHFAVAELKDSNKDSVAKLLYSQPRAQARLAAVMEYPPAKWLLEQELIARNKWDANTVDVDVYDHALTLNSTGICFSGGGIRSATFNLGVLQGLAAQDYLNSFDYLSSVSGGGYIHQFLASWISCENIEQVKEQLQPLPGPPSTRTFWPDPLRWLRRYSNYLTPQVGLFTADTWVAFAIWARNTFLNQIVLISSMLIVLLLPHFYLSSKGRVAKYLLNHGGLTAFIILAGFTIGSAVIFFTQIKRPPGAACEDDEASVACKREKDEAKNDDETGLGQAGILAAVFFPILIAILAFCPYLYRSSFWAGNLLPHVRQIWQCSCMHEDPSDQKILDVVQRAAWPASAGIVAPSTRTYISQLHKLADVPSKEDAIASSCVQDDKAGALACTSLLTRQTAAEPPSPDNKKDGNKSSVQKRNRDIVHASALDNIRAWQTAYSFRWWRPIDTVPWKTVTFSTSPWQLHVDEARQVKPFELKKYCHKEGDVCVTDRGPSPVGDKHSWTLYRPNNNFSADSSASWVFLSMLAGISLLVLSGIRAIPAGFKRWIMVLGVIGAVGSGYVLINLSRLVIFLASFFLPLEHVTRLAIPLLPWLGVTIVFVSIEIAGGLVGSLVDESVREWFARLRAWSFLFGIVWLAVTGCSLVGPGIVRWLGHAHYGKPAWLGWILTTIGSVLVGKSSKINGSPKDAESKTAMIVNGLVLLGPPVFIAGLFIMLSWVVEKALLSIESQVGQLTIPHSDFAILFLLLAATAFIFGWRIDINEFSLHAFYRDRIARCYAGASNPERRANRFTGFAASDKRLRMIDLLPRSFDNESLQQLWAAKWDGQQRRPQKPKYEGPFPIFNTTLNLSFGQDLAYQERKGGSFVFTPLYCGYDVGWTETDSSRIQFNGYTPTRSFAYADGGPRMATAVATSGAAMSPNWGFHTSPTMAFLLTIFNVRLGLWIRNPRHKLFRLGNLGNEIEQQIQSIPNSFTSVRDPLLRSYRKWSQKTQVSFASLCFNMPRLDALVRSIVYRNPSSPTVGLFYLLAELFGMVNDSAAYVYLTDGGHFENMGLYELVRRRCKTIVICDSEQDGDLTFQGIGMAIRKCRIDHGAEIKLDLTQLEPIGDVPASPFCAIAGTISYPGGSNDPARKKADSEEEEPQDEEATMGRILYIKSVYTRDLPPDLINYRKENPSFPNTSTADQWFSESQFESYRRLGLHHATSARVKAWLEHHLDKRSENSAPPPEEEPGAPLPGAVPAPSPDE